MNRSFRQRLGALAGVLLVGTVVLAWASPASAQAPPPPPVSSTATLGSGPGAITVTCGPNSPAVQRTDINAADGLTGTAQCGANTNVSSAAQVTGTFNGTNFILQCSFVRDPNTGAVFTSFQEVQNGVITAQGAGPGTGFGSRTLVIGGVTVASVNCLPAGQAYPLAVDASGASEAAGPALVTQPAASDDSSGRGMWLVLAGAAALLVVAGQLAMGRRIGRRGSQATN